MEKSRPGPANTLFGPLVHIHHPLRLHSSYIAVLPFLAALRGSVPAEDAKGRGEGGKTSQLPWIECQMPEINFNLECIGTCKMFCAAGWGRTCCFLRLMEAKNWTGRVLGVGASRAR